MSKPFVPTPNVSRPITPPLSYGKDDITSTLLRDMGGRGDKSKEKEDIGQKEGAPTGREQALPILSYCVASIMMTVVNKYVVSGAHFTMTFLLLAIQSGVCVLAVSTVKRLVRDFDKNDAKKWWPISTLLVAVIHTGSKALVGSSIIAAWSDISSVWAKKPELDPITGLEIVVGPSATIGGLNIGYMWMALNCLVSAAYVLFMRKRIKITGFKDWDTMYYNNILSVPILVTFSLVIEDWGSESLALNFPAENRVLLLSAMAFSGAAAVFISYSTAWCVRITGSTTYSMVGALNKLPVAASGILFFGDPANFGNVFAIAVGGLAGIVYAIAKTNQAKVEKAKQARAAGGRP
nr:GDP-mannose transporter 1 [Cryptococcus depauperatus CBS 7855]